MRSVVCKKWFENFGSDDMVHGGCGGGGMV